MSTGRLLPWPDQLITSSYIFGYALTQLHSLPIEELMEGRLWDTDPYMLRRSPLITPSS